MESMLFYQKGEGYPIRTPFVDVERITLRERLPKKRMFTFGHEIFSGGVILESDTKQLH